MSGRLAELDDAEPTRSAEGAEAVSEEAVGGGDGDAGVISAASPPVGLSEATGRFTASLPLDALSNSIQALKNQQKELRDQKMRLTKDLRNQERRRKRLRTRARQLTDEDLV